MEYYVSNLVDSIHKCSKEVDELEREIEGLQKRLYEKIDVQKELKGKRKYYNTILDILDREETKEEVKEEPKKDLKDFLGVDKDTSLYTILRQIGILD